MILKVFSDIEAIVLQVMGFVNNCFSERGIFAGVKEHINLLKESVRK